VEVVCGGMVWLRGLIETEAVYTADVAYVLHVQDFKRVLASSLCRKTVFVDPGTRVV